MKRTCVICGQEFECGGTWFYKTNRSSGAMTCSKECSDELTRQRKRKYARDGSQLEWNRRYCKRFEILELLGNKCLRCGETDWRVLQIDHVDGGGRKEMHRFRNLYIYYEYVLKKIKSGSKDYQCLCANCNIRKEHEKRELSSKTWLP